MIHAVELYCGIGGFAKACEAFNIHVKYAYDQNDSALSTYNANFTHKAEKYNLEKFNADLLDALHVDFLWMSPPCQPYTRKGVQKDIADSRSDSFLNVLKALCICKHPPQHVGMENVEGFMDSQARLILLETLKEKGYNICETLLCPSELGIPNRRMRYYLCASLKPLKALKKSLHVKDLQEFLQETKIPFIIPQEVLEKFKNGFRIIDANDKEAYTTCFTSSYGKSWMHSGAYLTCKDEVRLFEPQEIAALMGFGNDFIFPSHLTKRQCYKLIGNSLSVYALSSILTQFDV